MKGYSQAGFSLLELLVALFVIVIITSLVTLAINSDGQDVALDAKAKSLADISSFAMDEAQMRAVDMGLLIQQVDEGGERLYRYGWRERKVSGSADRGFGIESLRKAEVQNLDNTVGRNYDIGGLEIPVNHPVSVGRFEPFRHLAANVQGFLQRQGSRLQHLRQRFSRDQLQYKEVNAIARFKPVDGGDVGMVQGGEEFRFALEAGKALRVPCEFLG